MGNSVMLNGVEYAGEQIAYKDSTYELVSKVAYLIGVRAAREPNGAASRKARKNLCSRSNLYDLESLPWINW